MSSNTTSSTVTLDLASIMERVATGESSMGTTYRFTLEADAIDVMRSVKTPSATLASQLGEVFKGYDFMGDWNTYSADRVLAKVRVDEVSFRVVDTRVGPFVLLANFGGSVATGQRRPDGTPATRSTWHVFGVRKFEPGEQDAAIDWMNFLVGAERCIIESRLANELGFDAESSEYQAFVDAYGAQDIDREAELDALRELMEG